MSIDDLDFSSLHESAPSEQKKKDEKPASTGIKVRKSASNPPAPQLAGGNPGISVENPSGVGLNYGKIAENAQTMSNAAGEPKIPEDVTNTLKWLGIGGAGLLGALQLQKWWQDHQGAVKGLAEAEQASALKTDLRNPQPVAATSVAPQPTFPQATTQQPALPQGYGQQTINAPTGAPAVPPTAGAGPQPVAPMTHEQLMQQEALEQARLKTENLRLKNQKLQTPATTAPASAKGSVSEADLKLLQQHGFNETSKQLQAKEAASKLSPTPDPIQTTATPVEKQTAVDVVKRQEQKQVGVKPEYPKKEVFKTVPEGYVFRPDVGNLDRSLGNVLGLEHREYARELFNQGKPFGHSADVNKDVSRITTEYFKHLQSQVPETILSRDARKLQNIPSDFGTFAKNTDFGQKAKVAGTLGTLLAATSAANAATKGDMAPTKELGFDLAAGAGLAKVLGGPAALIASLGLGSAGLNKDEEKQLAYRQKVGSGRGIAPPSSYQR